MLASRLRGPRLVRQGKWAGERARSCRRDADSRRRTLSRLRLGPRTNVLERLGPQSNVHARLGPQGARVRERWHDERNNRRPPASLRTNTRQQAVKGSSQAQPSHLPRGQGNQGDRPF
ncbi:unnamed protein product [Prunus armeniaca]